MKNKEDSSKIKKDFDQFHNELNEIRKETEELNKNLPVNKNNKQASYELKVKDAIGKFITLQYIFMSLLYNLQAW